MSWTCQLGCDEPIEVNEVDDILHHLRQFHPDRFEDFERWPDGEIVVHDLTLEPQDFNGERER